MPNIASVLKAEIARIARKELRTGNQATQRAVASHRKQIADLKRQLLALRREVASLRKHQVKSTELKSQDSGPSLRFRAEGFAQHRKRLGLSAREVGQLIGASALSVYKWEQGKARPRANHLEAIATLRKMGKREAMQRLERGQG